MRVRILECRKQPRCHFFISAAIAHEKMNILVSVLNIFFHEVKLNMQDYIYLEFIKFQLGLRINMPVFANCNV